MNAPKTLSTKLPRSRERAQSGNQFPHAKDSFDTMLAMVVIVVALVASVLIYWTGSNGVRTASVDAFPSHSSVDGFAR